jgi:anaerobic magnesium-protoporphyrin IX monomethyl ester cyclase
VSSETEAHIDALWRRVDELEPVSRDAEALSPEGISDFASSAAAPVEQLVQLRGA